MISFSKIQHIMLRKYLFPWFDLLNEFYRQKFNKTTSKNKINKPNSNVNGNNLCSLYTEIFEKGINPQLSTQSHHQLSWQNVGNASLMTCQNSWQKKRDCMNKLFGQDTITTSPAQAIATKSCYPFCQPWQELITNPV